MIFYDFSKNFDQKTKKYSFFALPNASVKWPIMMINNDPHNFRIHNIYILGGVICVILPPLFYGKVRRPIPGYL